MKRLIILLLLSQSLFLCYSQPTVEDLEAEIKNYEYLIDLYEQKIDSVQKIIQTINADQYKELSSFGIPFQAKVKISIRDDLKPWLSEELEDIPKGDTVTIMRQVEDFTYEVIHKGRMGYISKFSVSGAVDDEILGYLENQWEVQNAEDKALNKEEANAKAKETKERRKQYLISKYGTTNGTKILSGKIWIGMTAEMARDSWGSPSDINRTVGTWGAHEQWVYDVIDTYLYFENGKLTSWQD